MPTPERAGAPANRGNPGESRGDGRPPPGHTRPRTVDQVAAEATGPEDSATTGPLMTFPLAPAAPFGATTMGAPDPGRGPVPRTEFATLLRAHERCESGGRFVASARATTAGAPAGYGRSQLNTRNHVELLGRLGDARLARLGVSRDDLAALAERGAAAQDYYAAIVGGRRREGSVVGPGEQALIDAVAAKSPATLADLDVLVAGLGEGFARTTGLPPGELRFLSATRLLGSTRLAREYGETFRVTGDRTAALDALTARHPTLALLRDRVGDAWTVRYLTDGRLNENRAAWYTRAAMTADAPFERLQGALRAGGDRLNAEHLWADHLRRALTVATGLDAWATLPEGDRMELLGQLARLRALSPAIFALVTAPRDAAAPLATVQDLQDRLATFRADPTSDAGAALRAFDRAFTGA